MRNRIRFLLPVLLLIGILTSVAAFAANASACDHTPGDWKVVTDPFAFLPGEKSRTCTQCGETVETAAVYNTFGLGDAGNVDKYITGVYSEVTPATLKEHFRKTGYEVTIVDANGAEPTLVSTGSKVIVGSDEYEVVVKGDVTGDGVIDIFDLLLLLGYANGEEELEGAYQKAGLISNREEADIFDLLALLDHANGGVSIEPSAPPSTETEAPETEPPVTEPPVPECQTHKYVLESNTGSCTADGVKTYACSVCGDSYTEAVTATGHDFDKGKVTTPATCGQAGVKTYTCKNGCGTTETETIAAKTHVWSVATVTIEPTCTEKGLKSYYCLYGCGATKTAGIAPLGHDYVDTVCQREGCGKINYVDVIILAGQSNAVGVGHRAYLPEHFGTIAYNNFLMGYDNIRIRFYSHNQKNTTFEKVTFGQAELGRDTFGPEVGIADYFGQRYDDREIVIVKCAFGSTSLAHDWAGPEDRYVTSNGVSYRPVGGTFDREAGWCLDELYALLDESIAALKADGYVPVISGFCWMQGENDASYDVTTAAYGDRYRRMMADFSTRYEAYARDCIYVDGGISTIWRNYQAINEFKRAYAAESDNRAYIDTIAVGLTTTWEPVGSPDIYHYDSASVIKLGRLFAAAIDGGTKS